jgi:hypothetical protein
MAVGEWVMLSFFTGLAIGLLAGMKGRDRIWRGKGDHKYMNRMESGGSLYTVKRDKP